VNIAVTGGLGSGKSTASRILAVAMSAEHLDTDQLSRQQLQPGNPGYTAFTEVFGDRYLFPDGSINKQLLRQDVFTDNEVRTELEMILHPLVRKEVADYYAQCCAAGKNLVVEIPLLFEVGWQDDFTVSVVVFVSELLCFKRVAARDGFTIAEIQRVCAAQLPLTEKVKRAQFVIDNSGTFVSTVQQIAWLSKNLQGKADDQTCAKRVTAAL
jgi:dephospho-CoA kinase